MAPKAEEVLVTVVTYNIVNNMRLSSFRQSLGVFLLLISRCCAVDTNQIDMLRARAYSMVEDSPEYLSTWQKILALDPANLEAHVMLGWKLLTSSNSGMQEYGIGLLENSFDEKKVSPTIVSFLSNNAWHANCRPSQQCSWNLSRI